MMSTNTSSTPVNPNYKRSHKHLNYIPWEPTRAAVSRVEQQDKNIPSLPSSSLATQLYRYQNMSKPPSPPLTANKETIPLTNRIKPTATVEPFQASINIDEILYGVR